MEVKDVELLKVLQRSHVAVPKSFVVEERTEDPPPVRPMCECKHVWNGEN